jgi:hypothetical protein
MNTPIAVWFRLSGVSILREKALLKASGPYIIDTQDLEFPALRRQGPSAR